MMPRTLLVMSGLPEPDWQAVQSRRLHVTPWRPPVISVDSASPLGENVERVVLALGAPGTKPPVS